METRLILKITFTYHFSTVSLTLGERGLGDGHVEVRERRATTTRFASSRRRIILCRRSSKFTCRPRALLQRAAARQARRARHPRGGGAAVFSPRCCSAACACGVPSPAPPRAPRNDARAGVVAPAGVADVLRAHGAGPPRHAGAGTRAAECPRRRAAAGRLGLAGRGMGPPARAAHSRCGRRGGHGDAFLRPHPHLREQCEPPPRNAVSLAQWEREREGGAPRGRANNRGCVPRGVALLMLHGWRRADGPRWGWSQPVVRQRSSRSGVGRAPVIRHGRGAASLFRPQT